MKWLIGIETRAREGLHMPRHGVSSTKMETASELKMAVREIRNLGDNYQFIMLRRRHVRYHDEYGPSDRLRRYYGHHLE